MKSLIMKDEKSINRDKKLCNLHMHHTSAESLESNWQLQQIVVPSSEVDTICYEL